MIKLLRTLAVLSVAVALTFSGTAGHFLPWWGAAVVPLAGVVGYVGTRWLSSTSTSLDTFYPKGVAVTCMIGVACVYLGMLPTVSDSAGSGLIGLGGIVIGVGALLSFLPILGEN